MAKIKPRFFGVAVVAALGLLLVSGGYWLMTSRNQDYRKLARTRTGVLFDVIKNIHGEPYAMEKSGQYTQAIFSSTNFFLQVIFDDTQMVKFFAVTSRNENFHPPIDTGSKKIFYLGKFRFEEMDGLTEKPQSPDVSAHSYTFFEKHFFGNPGNGQTFYLALNAPPGVEYTPIVPLKTDSGMAGLPDIESFRRSNVPNTYALAAMDFKEEEQVLEYFGVGVSYTDARQAEPDSADPSSEQ